MKIVVKENYLEASIHAADMIAELIRNKPNCTLGLATGGTPIGTYQHLIKLYNEGLDFSRVKTFNLDEYIGIGKDLSKPYSADQSYARFMYEELFRYINVKEENIHIPNGLAENPEEFCTAYEEAIRNAGGMDLQLLGIGGDGHIGFNEPGSSLSSRTRVEALTQQTLDDNYEAFYKAAEVPKYLMPDKAITMGIGTILEARSIIMLASGSKKAEIISQALEGPVSTDVTASALQLFTGKCTVILDHDAAKNLKKR